MKKYKNLASIALTAAAMSIIYPGPVSARPLNWDCGKLGVIKVSDFGGPNQVVYITADKLNISNVKGISKGGANWLAIESPPLNLFSGGEGIFARRFVGSGRFFNGEEVKCKYL
tara:strand:- start:151 stop:492 length:342 start_codon:yes stop_codon:yes gene_type:complete